MFSALRSSSEEGFWWDSRRCDAGRCVAALQNEGEGDDGATHVEIPLGHFLYWQSPLRVVEGEDVFRISRLRRHGAPILWPRAEHASERTEEFESTEASSSSQSSGAVSVRGLKQMSVSPTPHAREIVRCCSSLTQQ